MTNSKRRTGVLAVVIGALLLANLLLPQLLFTPYRFVLQEQLACFLSGGLVAEVCLLANWAALGVQPIILRVPVTFGLLVAAASVYLVGLQPQGDEMPLDVALVVELLAMIMFVGMVAPLALMRSFSGSRIEPPDHVPSSNRDRSSQFGLKHLLGGTAAMAVLIVLIQQAMPDNRLDGAWDEWGTALAAASGFMMFSAAVNIPCVLLVLGDGRRWRWAGALVFVAGLGPVLVFASTLLVFEFGRPPVFEAIEIVVGIYLFGGGVICTTVVVLWLSRRLGYRLVAR